PLVADASSDVFSRPIDVGKYALLYAGAQKNLGPAGVTMVVTREDLLARTPKGLPTMLDYNTHAQSKSLYNTPPVFAIYVVRPAGVLGPQGTPLGRRHSRVDLQRVSEEGRGSARILPERFRRPQRVGRRQTIRLVLTARSSGE